jgi:hypothetical protein
LVEPVHLLKREEGKKGIEEVIKEINEEINKRNQRNPERKEDHHRHPEVYTLGLQLTVKFKRQQRSRPQIPEPNSNFNISSRVAPYQASPTARSCSTLDAGGEKDHTRPE